jgi:opacity protein-like surface antigen
MSLRAVARIVLLSLFAAMPARADEPAWTVFGGYGMTHVGMGLTRTHVETADIILRRQWALVDGAGSSWYAGHHDILLELPVSYATTQGGPMIGLNFLASYFFSSFDGYEPYFFAGGGPVYIAPEIPGMGAHINGNYQGGAGAAFKPADGLKFNVEYRFHHISNAGAVSPNLPLNSSKLLVGIKFLW